MPEAVLDLSTLNRVGTGLALDQPSEWRAVPRVPFETMWPLIVLDAIPRCLRPRVAPALRYDVTIRAVVRRLVDLSRGLTDERLFADTYRRQFTLRL